MGMRLSMKCGVFQNDSRSALGRPMRIIHEFADRAKQAVRAVTRPQYVCYAAVFLFLLPPERGGRAAIE